MARPPGDTSVWDRDVLEVAIQSHPGVLLPCASASVWHRAGAAPKGLPQTHAILSVLYNNHGHKHCLYFQRGAVVSRALLFQGEISGGKIIALHAPSIPVLGRAASPQHICVDH